jgi:hypothetical protein
MNDQTIKNNSHTIMLKHQNPDGILDMFSTQIDLDKISNDSNIQLSSLIKQAKKDIFKMFYQCYGQEKTTLNLDDFCFVYSKNIIDSLSRQLHIIDKLDLQKQVEQ